MAATTRKFKQILCLGFVVMTIYIIYCYNCSTNNSRSTPGRNFEMSSMANASNIGLDLGRTELEQYHQYTKMYTGAPRRMTAEGYSYNVKLIGNRPTIEGIFVRIDERYQNRSTEGGSTFVITSESYGVLLCPYRDMFNGIYFVWCPPVVLGERKTITVMLQYVDFNAFRIERLKSLSSVIGEFDIRLDRRPVTPKPLNNPNILSIMKNYMNKQDVVQWYQEDERWIVQLASGDRFFTPEISDMCNCVKRMHRVVLVGASHLRYVFDYVAEQCYHQRTPGFLLNGSAAIENLVYLYAYNEHQLYKATRKGYFGITLREDDVILTQWGSHSLANNGLQYTLETALQKYVDTIVAVRKMSRVPPSRFIVVIQPPFSYHLTGRRYNGNRNSACVAVVTRKLKSMLTTHKFNIFDQFSILQPQQDRDVCFAHYMCRVFNGEHTRVYGDVGIHVAKLMMAHICMRS